VKTNDIAKIQTICTRLLAELDRICRNGGITYYMIAGTLLGAVRHNGFIPWDDDVDVAMPRRDYEKFKKIAPNQLTATTVLQTWENDSGFSGFMVRLVDINTILDEKRKQDLGVKQTGVSIDIFPLDDTARECGFLLTLQHALFKIFNEFSVTKRFVWRRASVKRKILIMVLSPFFWIMPDCRKLTDAVMQWQNSSHSKYYIYMGTHYHYKHYLSPKSAWGKGVDLEFNGHTFRAPDSYFRMLEKWYGKDYMQIPPKEKQKSGHCFKLTILNQGTISRNGE
jgi:lipopolysaccharide cholinephosphotransferase